MVAPDEGLATVQQFAKTGLQIPQDSLRHRESSSETSVGRLSLKSQSPAVERAKAIRSGSEPSGGAFRLSRRSIRSDSAVLRRNIGPTITAVHSYYTQNPHAPTLPGSPALNAQHTRTAPKSKSTHPHKGGRSETLPFPLPVKPVLGVLHFGTNSATPPWDSSASKFDTKQRPRS